VFLNLSKTLMVLLICLTFLGQAMASTIVYYNMMGMQHVKNQEQASTVPSKSMVGEPQLTMADNSLPDSNVEKDNCCDSECADCCDISKDKCCDGFCHCFTSGYISLVSLNETQNNSFFIDLPSKIHFFSRHVESETLTSLYRPPILLS
jgi:hypothetical protein